VNNPGRGWIYAGAEKAEVVLIEKKKGMGGRHA